MKRAANRELTEQRQHPGIAAARDHGNQRPAASLPRAIAHETAGVAIEHAQTGEQGVDAPRRQQLPRAGHGDFEVVGRRRPDLMRGPANPIREQPVGLSQLPDDLLQRNAAYPSPGATSSPTRAIVILRTAEPDSGGHVKRIFAVRGTDPKTARTRGACQVG